MAFQIKDFRSIAASLINLMRANQAKVTDFSVGSVARTMLDAPAAEIEQLYINMHLGLQEAIPVAIYKAFSFQRLDATAATGVMRIDITASATDTVIPANTEFVPLSGAALHYLTQTDLVITAGATQGDVLVACSTTGPTGNQDASVSFGLISSFSAFVSASNPAPIIGGSEQETDDQRASRFAAFVLSIARGTIDAVRYGLTLAKLTDALGQVTEQVRYTKIVEPYVDDDTQPVGWIECYIHNGVSGASSDLIARATQILYGYTDSAGVRFPGYKAAGVKTDVIAATTLTQNVAMTITALTGFDHAVITQLITDGVDDYLQALDIGIKLVHAELVAVAMSVPGVYNCVVGTPAGDVTPTATQKIMPGTVTITYA